MKKVKYIKININILIYIKILFFLILKKEKNIEKIERPSINSNRIRENRLSMKNSNKTKDQSIDINNLLLRGSSLRNTDYIYGVVIYTGHNNKIMKNSLKSRSKVSSVSKIVNTHLIFIIIIQFMISLIMTILNYFQENFFSDFFLFTDYDPVDLKGHLFIFFNWILALQNIVPISLLVTLEMIKFCQAILISWDIKIYDQINSRSVIVQSSGLNEELGQVNVKLNNK